MITLKAILQDLTGDEKFHFPLFSSSNYEITVVINIFQAFGVFILAALRKI